MGLGGHLKALLLKNWLLWKRELCGSICEIVFPVVLMIFLYLIKIAIGTTDKSADSYIKSHSQLVAPFEIFMNQNITKDVFNISTSNMGDSFPFQWCNKVLKYDWQWAAVYNDSDPTSESLMSYIKVNIHNYFNISNSVNPERVPVPINFAKNSKLDDYITDSDYGDGSRHKLCFAIVLEYENANHLNVKIRYNITDTDPSITSVYGQFLTIFLTGLIEPVNKYQKQVETTYQEDFVKSGFLTIQNLVMNGITQSKAPGSPILASIFVPMHGIKYINDPFMTNFAGTLGFFLFVTSLVPVCRMISKVVTEKETKVRESMKMMGLSDTPYWLSWLIMYTLIYFVIAFLSTLVGFGIFEYCNKFILFLLFFLYGLSCLAFSVLICSIFNKAKTAVLVGMLIFFVSYFTLLSVTNTTSEGVISLLSFFNTVAMSQAFIQLMSFEGSQIGIDFSNINDNFYNYSVGRGLIFLLVDTILYWLLALYLDKVIKTETGVNLPWYFPFSPAFWKGHASSKALSDEAEALLREEDERRRRSLHENANIEELDPALETQLKNGQAMEVKGLRKHFEDKVAVDGLDLSMFKGQIFALLGHNGAGKTTTISMLTGMIAPTAGEMTVNNLNFRTDMPEIRKSLGVCPQHDILFKTLTVEEHLYLFCRFKGIENKAEIQGMIDEKLADIDLLEKRTTKAGNLSGGQKRKLSLAIALIGGSNIVMLDEPTSGMDLTARRKMWDMLKREKRGRIIILTTHYMEEADILADRIAIMAQGKLYCSGSPLFLKRRFGVGYNLSIVKSIEGGKQPDFSRIQNLVMRHLPESKVFNTASAEILFEIPLESTHKFKNFFEELDETKEKLAIEAYGISVTTLEEVFIRVSRGDEGGSQEHRKTISPSHHEEAVEELQTTEKFDSEIINSDDFNIAEHRIKGILFFSHFKALIKKRIIFSIRDVKGIVLEICLPIVFVILGLILLTQFSVYSDQPQQLMSFAHYDSDQNILYYVPSTEISQKLPYSYITNNPSHFKDANLVEPTSAFTNVYDYDYYMYKNRKIDPYRLGSYYNVDTTQSVTKDITCIYVFANSTAFQSAPTFAAEYGKAFINSAIMQNDPTAPYYNLRLYNDPLPLTKKQQNLAQNAGSFYIALIFAIGMAFIPTGLVTFIVKERENNIKHQHLVSGVSIPAYWASAYTWDLVKYFIPGIITPLLIKAFDLKTLTDPVEVYNAVWALFVMFGFAICPYTYAVSFMFKSYSIAQFFIFLLNLIIGVVGALAIWVLIIITDITRDIASVLVYPFRVISPIFCLSMGLMTVGNRDAYQIAYGQSSEPGAFDWDITGADLFFLFLHTVIGSIVVFMIEWLSNVTFFRNLIGARDPGQGEFQEDDDVARMRIEAQNSSPNDVAVKVSGLRKIYGNLFNKNDVKIAIQEVSFTVKPQQAFALLGVNGAGKTSTFRILTGEYGPTTGEAYISGYNVVTELSKARYNIGYCPQFDALSEVLTPVEHLQLYARIKGIPDNLVQTFVDKQIRDMGLEKYVKVRAGNLSGGNKRKLSVAIATIGNPPVVFLDEPSAGMDPNARKNMWEVVNRIKRQKCSIILTTHSMDEAESLCNTMAIMVGGRFKCFGTATHIKNKYSSGYEFLLKVIYPDSQEITNLVGALSGFTTAGFIMDNKVQAALDAADAGDLNERIGDHESGSHLYEELKENKKLDVRSLVEWVLLEKLGNLIYDWLEKEFGEIRLIEHYGSYYKFKLEKNQNFSIGYLFGRIEEVKAQLSINEYSLSQTTLEQIFNMFASEGDVSKSKKRMSGLHPSVNPS